MTDAEIVELALRRTANRLQTWDTRMADFLTFTADDIQKQLKARYGEELAVSRRLDGEAEQTRVWWGQQPE